jgi:hypothetical protein
VCILNGILVFKITQLVTRPYIRCSMKCIDLN